MINIRDEQTTNTTIPEEPIPGRTSTAPPGSTEGEGGFRTLFQWQGHRPRMTFRVAFFGGLAGAIFFFGLAVAILSGHFWEVFLVVLAICCEVSSLSSSKAEAIFAGIEGFALLLGLAVLAFTGWWWPGILVVLGIAALLGIGYGLLTRWRLPGRA